MGRVVLGATGEGDDWLVLREELAGRGWQVDLFDPTPRPDDGGPEASLPLLHGVDLAILLAAAPAGGLDRQANSRLIFLAGHLEGLLPGRVVFVRERGAESLAAGTGVAELEYSAGDVTALVPRIMALLAESAIPVEPRPILAPWRDRFGVVDRTPAPEALLALAVLLAVAAPIIMLVGLQGFGRSADDAPELSAEVAGPETTGGISVGEAGAADAPPSAGEVGSVIGLPARCEIVLAPGALLGPTIPCGEGSGGILVDGHRGPWRQELWIVRPDLGVVVEATMVPSLASTPGLEVTLNADTDNDMEALGSGSGVDRLVLVFTADGQEVTLRQRDERGGNQARLIYGLELG